MNKKFTIDTIKDLKVRVKELNETFSMFYTKTQFLPDDTFRLSIEECDIPEIDKSIVENMISALENNETEFEAGKILFECLTITPKQASDIGFWTYQNHYTFYRYISKRWINLWEDDVINPSSYIINHWIQSNSSQGELIDYPISGLWWSFYLTIDEEREDKYELTKIFFKNLSIRTKLLGAARFARHKPAIIGILEFIKEKKLDSNSLEQAGRAIVPYINLLGGIRPLTYFDKNWFKSKLENRFGEQIKKGEKIFRRPEDISTVTKKTESVENKSDQKNHQKFFCLNSETGNYRISSQMDKNCDYCIELDAENQNQFLIHFYKEGKIKKSKIDGMLLNKTIDRSKPYSNGKCSKLSIYDIVLINEPVLFGIAYKTKSGIYFKAMDEHNKDNFRDDNSDLHQEGKKVLYIDEKFNSAYKILPYVIKDSLGTLVQQSPTSKGAKIDNKYYQSKWDVLKNYWPELFNNTIIWK